MLLDDGSESSKQHWKYVLDFISLYAGRSAIRTSGDWVVVGETLRLLFQILLETQFDQSIMKQTLNTDKALAGPPVRQYAAIPGKGIPGNKTDLSQGKAVDFSRDYILVGPFKYLWLAGRTLNR